MSKIYKNWELIKAITDGEIKNGAKIIPHYPNDNCTVEYFEYSYGFFEAYYKEGRRSDNDVNICVFLDNDRTFEVIGDETDIDIDSIEEIKWTEINGTGDKQDEFVLEKNGRYICANYDDVEMELVRTVNKLRQALKQIDKRIKELEE